MCHTTGTPPAAELTGALERVADSLQVLVLAVESCQRDLDPRWGSSGSPQYAVTARLLAVAAEMKTLLIELRKGLGRSDAVT